MMERKCTGFGIECCLLVCTKIGHFKNRVDMVSKSDDIPSIMLLIWKLVFFQQSLMLVQVT